MQLNSTTTQLNQPINLCKALLHKNYFLSLCLLCSHTDILSNTLFKTTNWLMFRQKDNKSSAAFSSLILYVVLYILYFVFCILYSAQDFAPWRSDRATRFCVIGPRLPLTVTIICNTNYLPNNWAIVWGAC